MTIFLTLFGIGLVLQFIWLVFREYQILSEERDRRMADAVARDIITRHLIGRIHALEEKRDRNRIGTCEYEALDLEAYDARRALAELIDSE